MAVAKRRALVEDWANIHHKIGRFAWAEETVLKLRPETDWWVVNYRDDSSRVAGWMHHYFCTNCSSPLEFDKSAPDRHRCGSCGTDCSGEDIQNAWHAAYRSAASQQVLNAAVWFKLYHDPAYLSFIRAVLDFYSDNLSLFQVNTPKGFEGVFSGINLSDAVLLTAMIRGMEMVREHFTAEELQRYKEQFFLPMAAFLCRTAGGTPNISCWMRGAAGMIGLFFEEYGVCREVAEGFEGIKETLANGLLKGGFWYESSFHYHYYCAEGLTYYAVFCELYGYDFPELADAMKRMYRYPLQYSFPTGQFPSPNDGWPNRSFADYAAQYEWIRSVYDEDAFRYALALSYDKEKCPLEGGAQRPEAGGMARLLFGTDWTGEWNAQAASQQATVGHPPRVSRMDEDIYYIFLQHEEASVFLKYGFVIAEHAHADVMNFELYVKDRFVSRDISNSGYGTDLFREWQRKSIAHNTVLVDGRNQPNRPHGQLVAFDAATNSCKVAAAEVYPGVDYERSLQLLQDRLTDVFAVTVKQEATEGQSPPAHTFDWLFHCAGEIVHDLPLRRCSPPGEAEGYQLMEEVSSCEVDGTCHISWELPNQRLTLTMQGCPGTTVYLFKGYEHRLDLQRWGIMARRTGDSAVFEADYSFHVY
ncbi:hypothetical protein EBB07_08665 [Paenibacillaceae bacterium]|nr:hypothetical protein EBB07_08665 [Paenibacillaceae bacterium]